MSSKIVLTMIVKNEGHVIERVLNSVLPIISSYCIVDTGSTDDTKEKIQNFFKEKGIDGKLLDFPFTNFEECRNLTIQEGKELGDYGFWIDADEELVLDKNFKDISEFLKSSGYKDLYGVSCEYGSMVYTRTQLYKFSRCFKWVGPVHEYLTTEDGGDYTRDNFLGGRVKIYAEGGSWKEETATKYKNHAKILKEYQEKHNWEDPRWTFYLAQSYRDAGQSLLIKNHQDSEGLDLIKKSIHYYKERVNNGKGYREERYFSQLMVARLSYYVGTNEEVFLELLRCEEYNLWNRCEHYFGIISYLQRENMFKSAETYCIQALKKIKTGLSGSLFTENYIYDWAVYDMYGTTLYYLGKHEDALKYSKYAIKNGTAKNNLSITERKRIEDNIRAIENSITGKRKGV